ncbi:hypothetical protein ACFE04_017554 [Oxalis oulophora]
MAQLQPTTISVQKDEDDMRGLLRDALGLTSFDLGCESSGGIGDENIGHSDEENDDEFEDVIQSNALIPNPLHTVDPIRYQKMLDECELNYMIRQEMENNRHCNDKKQICFLVSQGSVKIKRLDEMLDMQGH